MVRSIILMLFTCIYMYLPAQDDTIQATIETPPAQQTGHVDFRVPKEEKLKPYQEDSRFRYQRVEKEASWWNKLTYEISRFISKLFSTVAESGVPGYIVVIAIIVIICLIILKLAGVDFRSVFGKKKMDTPEIDIYTENVHNMDFDSLISNALKNNDYRLAVRFLYLKNLKLLSDKEIIEWKANKTNYSYQYEIENPEIRSRFMETSFIFDYIWYGEFIPTGANFPTIHNRMDAFSKMITDER